LVLEQQAKIDLGSHGSANPMNYRICWCQIFVYGITEVLITDANHTIYAEPIRIRVSVSGRYGYGIWYFKKNANMGISFNTLLFSRIGLALSGS
jgi:hypothetical protein